MKEFLESEGHRWDAFLEKNACGQFQQSSKWAKVKALDGWNCHREVLYQSGEIHGGYQILWRKSGWIRIGYISKGPVLKNEKPASIHDALESICSVSKELSLDAVIVQPPDDSQMNICQLHKFKFYKWSVPSIVDTTMIFDLKGTLCEVEGRMSRTIRKQARQGSKRQLTLYTGDRKDLKEFFALMKASCLRQKTVANPSRVEIFESIWDQFFPKVRLTFAQVEGKRVAGIFLFGFGDRVTVWKKGWNGEAEGSNPNSFLNVECLIYAKTQDYSIADFIAGDRSIADSIQRGIPLTQKQLNTRYMFNLRLGANPKIIPSAHLLVVDQTLRFALNVLTSNGFLRKFLLKPMKMS